MDIGYTIWFILLVCYNHWIYIYNVLSDMELINNNTLQVVDTSTALDKKEKIVNIDLSDKNYKSSVVDQKYSLIRIIQ